MDMPTGTSAAPHASALVAALEEAVLAARALLAALDPAAGHCRAAGQAEPGSPETGAGLGGLSRREAEVLRLLAGGLSTRQSAQILGVSPRTVQRHVANLYRKIGAHCRAEATAYALRHRLA